ncbi:MAG: hypothetical protein CMJ64_03985 [Planctomycetaceae bacterium]|nr:hypothetical protein [Planctomycetaceae bacterium]
MALVFAIRVRERQVLVMTSLAERTLRWERVESMEPLAMRTYLRRTMFSPARPKEMAAASLPTQHSLTLFETAFRPD